LREAGALFEEENVPLGAGASEPRHFLALRSTDPALVAALRDFLNGLPRPPDTRFVLGRLYEVDDSDQFVHSGWRSYLVHDHAELTESDVVDAVAKADDVQSLGMWFVLVTLTESAAERFEELTRAQVGRRIAILMDGELMSAPVVREPIPGGTLHITMGAGPAAQQREDALRLEAGLRAAGRSATAP
jgi:preprotein translocase subunit SecD